MLLLIKINSAFKQFNDRSLKDCSPTTRSDTLVCFPTEVSTPASTDGKPSN